MKRKDNERRVRIGRVEKFIQQLELAAMVSTTSQKGTLKKIADEMRKEFKLDGTEVLG